MLIKTYHEYVQKFNNDASRLQDYLLRSYIAANTSASCFIDAISELLQNNVFVSVNFSGLEGSDNVYDNMFMSTYKYCAHKYAKTFEEKVGLNNEASEMARDFLWSWGKLDGSPQYPSDVYNDCLEIFNFIMGWCSEKFQAPISNFLNAQ